MLWFRASLRPTIALLANLIVHPMIPGTVRPKVNQEY
jgi:hypothetical protein